MLRITSACLCFCSYLAVLLPLASCSVMLTVKVSTTDNNTINVAFDNVAYISPIPATGDKTGSVYVPESEQCVYDAFDITNPQPDKRPADSGMLLLPYDSCKDQWLRIVDSEVTKNRAVGVLLVIFRSDASEVAPEVKVGPDELSVPAWVVNGIVGAYITEGLNYEHKDRASRNSSITSTGNVWVEVERSKKLAITRKSFFFKAMIGIGIMGTLCFVLALVARYINISSIIRRHRRQRHQRRMARYDDDNDDDEGERVGQPSLLLQARLEPEDGDGSIGAHQHHRKRRVLNKYELAQIPLRSITYCQHLGKENAEHIAKPSPAAATSSLSYPMASRPAPGFEPSGGIWEAGKSVERQDSSLTFRSEPPQRSAGHSRLSRISMPLLRRLLIPASAWRTTPAKKSQLQLPLRDRQQQSPGILSYALQAADPSDNGPSHTDDGDRREVLECAICLESLLPGHLIRDLPCRHAFHGRCIDRWLLMQSVYCPLCKFDIKTSLSSAEKPSTEATTVIDNDEGNDGSSSNGGDSAGRREPTQQQVSVVQGSDNAAAATVPSESHHTPTEPRQAALSLPNHLPAFAVPFTARFDHHFTPPNNPF